MSSPLQLWHIRGDGQAFDANSVYDQYLSLFTMTIHHGGRFTDLPNRKYVDGEVTFVDLIDSNECKVDILDTVMYQCLGTEDKMFYHYKIPLKSLDIGLRTLANDSDMTEMIKYVKRHKTIYVYVEHVTTYLDTQFGPSNAIGNENDECESEPNDDCENEATDDSESEDNDESNSEANDESQSEDNDESESETEEHIVDEVEVNMNGFRFEVEGDFVDPMKPNLEITENDLDVLDFDSFESDVEDDTESARRKGLRKLRKHTSKTRSKNSFFVGKELPNKDVAKDMIRAHAVETRRNIQIVKNDKIRVRAQCFGMVPVTVKTVCIILIHYLIVTGRANCDLLINNICEVFNRQLLDAMDSPIISALEYVREYFMKMIVIVQKVIEKSEGPLTPAVTSIFRSIKKASIDYTVDWNGDGLFQVKGPWGEQCVVNLNQKVCGCRKWEVSGIPCKHVVACIHDMADNGMDVGLPEDWVHQSYKLKTWRDVYSFKVNPINGRQYWKKFDCPTTLLPPKKHPQVGRPQKNRRKSADEIVMVKDGKLSRKGHNKRSCKEKGQAASQSQSQAGKKRSRVNEVAASQAGSHSAAAGPKKARN